MVKDFSLQVGGAAIAIAAFARSRHEKEQQEAGLVDMTRILGPIKTPSEGLKHFLKKNIFVGKSFGNSSTNIEHPQPPC